MRPRPAFFQIWELEFRPSGRGNFQHRQCGAAASYPHAVLFLHNDKTDPGTQPLIGTGFRWNKQPGKIRAVEFDAGKQIIRIVGRKRARLGADDLPRIDRGDIGRSVELDVRRRGEFGKLECNRDGYVRGLIGR